MASKIGIIYAARTGMVRQLIIPDNDAALATQHPLLDGEAMLVADRVNISSVADARAAVAKAVGASPEPLRCAVVDRSGTVTAVIMADPTTDAVVGATLIQSDVAEIGWTTQDGALVAPPAVAPRVQPVMPMPPVPWLQ